MAAVKHIPTTIKNIIVLIAIFIVISALIVIYTSVRNIISLNRDINTLEATQTKQQSIVKDFNEEDIYNWKYASLSQHGNLDYNEQTEAQPFDPNIPSPPEQIQVINPEHGETLQIFWKDPETKFSTIKIYRSTKKDQLGTSITEVQPKQQYYIDANLQNNELYYYTIKSVLKNNSGQENESQNTKQYFASATDTTPPPPPSDINVENQGDGQTVVIKWKNPNVADFNSVTVYRSEVLGSVGNIIADNIKVETYKDKDLSSEKQYFYTITSVDDNGNESSTELQYSTPGKNNPFLP